jgi:cyanophycin synthetase
MHGRFFSAVRQDPACVIGDGIHRIDQLIENANLGRSDTLSHRLKKIQIDDGALRILRRQGLALDSIPLAGRQIFLREHSNLSVGGTYRNVTADVHADNKLLAERAARAVGLKVAGIDFITTDISRSYLEIGGGICEVNPSPGFVMGETGLAIENAYLDPFFPEGCNGRVPLVALLGDGPLDGRIAQMEDMARKLGHRPMVATPATLRIDGRTIARGNFTQGFIVEAALLEPTATAAIVQLTRRGTANEGLIFDRCNLAIVERGEAGADDPCQALLAGHCRTLLDLADQASVDAALSQILGSGP